MIYNKENEITDKDLTLYRDCMASCLMSRFFKEPVQTGFMRVLTDFDCRSVILTKGVTFKRTNLS